MDIDTENSLKEVIREKKKKGLRREQKGMRNEEGRERSEEGREGSEEGREGNEDGTEGSEEGREGNEDGREGSKEGREGSEEGREGSKEGREGKMIHKVPFMRHLHCFGKCLRVSSRQKRHEDNLLCQKAAVIPIPMSDQEEAQNVSCCCTMDRPVVIMCHVAAQWTGLLW